MNDENNAKPIEHDRGCDFLVLIQFNKNIFSEYRLKMKRTKLGDTILGEALELGNRLDWVTSAKPRSSLCCLPHQKGRISTSTSTAKLSASLWSIPVASLEVKISQGLRHFQIPLGLLQPSFLNGGLVTGGGEVADRRVFARIQITLPCQSRFLARNSPTHSWAALFARAEASLPHKGLCLFILPAAAKTTRLQVLVVYLCLPELSSYDGSCLFDTFPLPSAWQYLAPKLSDCSWCLIKCLIRSGYDNASSPLCRYA